MDIQEIRRRARVLRRKVLADIQLRHPSAENARQYLHPRYAAEFLGLKYEEHPELEMSLGVVGGARRKSAVIAGLFRPMEKLIVVSENFSEQERRFTGLHEVGHAVLHPDLRDAHRDRPIDLQDRSRAPREWQADQFAVEYSMPKAWVVRDAEERFGKIPIEINETLLWSLDPNDPDRLWKEGGDDLGLEKAIASYAGFGTMQAPSLKDIYGMSSTAMAWRVRELNLIDESSLRRCVGNTI